MKPPPPKYEDPAHVGVLWLLCLLGLATGAFFLATSGGEPEQMAFGAGAVIGGMYLAIFASVASNSARAAWQTARLAYELQPVIDEINRQAEARLKLERTAQRQQEAEIRRVLEARQAKEDSGPIA